MHQVSRSLALVAFAALALSGCGGSKSSDTQSTAGPVTEAQREAGALPSKVAAAVPSSLHCGSTKPVWANLKRKVYHESSDPYYGRTRSGQYMCLSDAQAKGYHAAGASHGRHHHRSGDSMSNGGADGPDPGSTD